MKVWIAEGLIEVKNEGELEDYAEDYLEELVQRCLVQVVKRFPDGAIESIRVHDLLREVALGEATENDFLLIWKEENVEMDVSMTRRVTFHKGINERRIIDHPKDLTTIKMPKLRTFLNFDKRNVIGIGFLLLRVLELRNTRSFIHLPKDFKNMIHLRYLGLRKTGVTVIPSWIGHLQNLQTFDIMGTNMQELPKSFWKITSLRHVHSALFSGKGPLEGPPSTANLVNLRSLGMFQVRKSWRNNFPHLPSVRKLKLRCQHKNDGMLIHDLQSKLNKLLSVTFDNFYPPREMIDFSTSPSYQNIHTMHLCGYVLGDRPTVHIAEMPPNLTKLTLSSYNLNDDPMAKLEKLRSLKCLELESISIEVDTIVCTNGGFPLLQSLQLFGVNKIKEWKVENEALPMLKYLRIKRCIDLRALPDLQCVTTLQELKIDEKLESTIENKSGEEWDKVKHIPTIKTY